MANAAQRLGEVALSEKVISTETSRMARGRGVGVVSAHLGLNSLLRLRWGAATAQLFLLFVARMAFEAELRLGVLLPLIAVTPLTNLLLAAKFKRRGPSSRQWMGWVLAFDTCVLTALLYASAGAANPFSVFYFVHMALAAVLLGATWTWGIAALSAACYGFLFLANPMAFSKADYEVGHFSTHLHGVWVAFVLAAGLIAYFVARLSEALRRHEKELVELREQAIKNDRLAALTTLAAGAAHELNTPLATVAVVAKEIQVKAARLVGASSRGIAEDARLIRTELERCRHILEQMSAQAGESLGEAPDSTPLDTLVEDLREKLSSDRRARLHVDTTLGPTHVLIPPRALVRVLSNLVSNAFDASAAGAFVTLTMRAVGSELALTVRDQGSGMPKEVLDRALEPFFTTKPQGVGLGLGLFLVKSFADRLGARLEIHSEQGKGTTVTLVVPNAPRQELPTPSSLRHAMAQVGA